MKNKITTILPDHTLTQSQSKHIYVVDYKNLNKGEVCLLEKEPKEIRYVYLNNDNKISIFFDGFKENALPISKGKYNRQCECVIFPEACNKSDWVLFVETKYTNNLGLAFKQENDYPNCMIKQIIETIDYFRAKGILEQSRRATAIVSFPNLVEEFNSTFFTKTDKAEIDILIEHNILIRATNSATIISPKRIKLDYKTPYMKIIAEQLLGLIEKNK